MPPVNIEVRHILIFYTQNIEQERLYSGGKSLNLMKSLLRTLKDLISSNLQGNCWLVTVLWILDEDTEPLYQR